MKRYVIVFENFKTGEKVFLYTYESSFVSALRTADDFLTFEKDLCVVEIKLK